MAKQPYPTRLKLEHTSFCNAQCIMCSHYFSNNTQKKMMDDSLEERIAPLLKYVKRILLQGSGEPLAHPHIARYIDKYADLGIEVTCNTNLSIMNEALAMAIGRAFKKIHISCDGCSSDVFEGIRKGLRFDVFKRNLKLLRESCPDLKIEMYTVALRQNILQLADIVSFAYEMGCDSIVITDLNPKDILDNEKDMIRNYPSVAKVNMSKAVAKAKELSLPIVYPKYILELKEVSTYQAELGIMESIPLFPSDDFQKKLQAFYKSLNLDSHSVRANETSFLADSGYHCNGICNYLLDEPYIDANGDVYPCCANGQYNIGNIYETSFEEIWNNKFYSGLRELFANGHIPQYCKGCLYLRNHYLNDVEVLDVDEGFFKQQYNVDMEDLTRRFKEFCKESSNE